MGVTGGWVVGVPAVADGGRGCVVGGRAAGDPPRAHPAARTPAARAASSTRLAIVVLRLTATTVTRRTRRDRSPGDDARWKERRSGGEPAGHRPGAARGLGPGRIRTAPAPGRGAPAAAVRAPAGPRSWRHWRACRPSTARWAVGGEAEERVGLLLRAAVGEAGFVLHDRAVPHSRANIDHIAVVASGVWVVDTKRYHGRVRRGRPPGRLVGRRTLVVNGHDRGHLVVAARRQRAVVEAVAGPGTPVRAVLCFADASWGAPHPALHVARRHGHLAPGPQPGPWRHRGLSARRSGPRWPAVSPGPSRPMPPRAPPTGRPAPRPGGSGRAGARAPLRAPSAAACRAGACRRRSSP